MIEIDQILGKLADKQQELAQIDREIAEAFQSLEANLFAENYIQKEDKAKMQ